MELPIFLVETIKKQYGEEVFEKIKEGYLPKRMLSLRVNTLKTTVDYIKQELRKKQIEWEEVGWNKEALLIKNVEEETIKEMAIYEKGEIYLQSLSSMLPPVIMEPKEHTDILDMTAAPGGKTTQIAALTNNNAHITACEMNTIRAERLRYNIEKQGATSVTIMQEDSRRLSQYFSFDQILLDAPCSGSGTIAIENKKTYEGITEKWLSKITQNQVTLLKKALQILKSGHEMVYSTCSILEEENEEVIKKVIREIPAEIVPIEMSRFADLPLLPTKIEGTICICPNEKYEGFFVAKIRKN